MIAKYVDNLIARYQVEVSPHVALGCRFTPTCSQYARDAIGNVGAMRGGLLALARWLRCWSRGRSGSDPAPRSITLAASIAAVARAAHERMTA